MKNLENILKNLNARQKQAVETIYGPLLIIAGPGTGKTQLLSSRVAQILKETDSDPGNILCLTFTAKAAVNMYERLQSLIGTDANFVKVRTFHSFAAEIINTHPDYFWNGARLSVAPDTLQLDVITRILDMLPHGNPLASKFNGTYTQLADIAQALKLSKEAGLTPKKLEALVNANLAYIDLIESDLVSILERPLGFKTLGELQKKVSELPEQGIDEKTAPLLSLSTLIKESLDFALKQDEETNKTKHTAKWKQRWIQNVSGRKGMFKERMRNKWWLALSEFYSHYVTEMHTLGFYDFGDMLVEVNSALEQNPGLLADIQEKFNFILIDEFQDTNPAQLRLAHLVANHPEYEGRPNLMAVGDDDQAIFRFQGAELNNVLHFKRMYKDTKIIVLSDNYRSSQAVLDTSERVINQANDRLVTRDRTISKKLKARGAPAKKGEIAHFIYPTRDYQFSAVAKLVKRLYKQNKDIAILSRNHDALKRQAAVLSQLGLPLSYEQMQNILEEPAVKDVVLIARLLSAIASGDKENTDYLLSQLLRSPIWNLDPKSLWEIALTARKDKPWLELIGKSRDPKLRAIGKWLLGLSMYSVSDPLPLVLEYILGLREFKGFNSPIKNYYLKTNNKEYLHALSALQLLRSMCDEIAINSSSGLNDLINLVEINSKNNRVITDFSPLVTAQNAVKLLTVFKAKGLEFDSVVLIDATGDNWQPKPARRIAPANLPLKNQGEDEDDYVRLLYVAMSRAKRNFYSFSYALDHAGNDKATSPLILNALSKVEKIDAKDAPNPIEILEQNIVWPALTEIDERETLKVRLENYELTVTGLINFLDLTKGGPEYFKEQNILRLPRAKEASLSYGTAIHAALERAQILNNKNKMNLAEAKKYFTKKLQNEFLPKADFQRYLKQGQEVLDFLFTKLRYRLPKGSLPEQKVTGVKIGEATIGGKLDRIDELGQRELLVVDYKTGKALTSFSTKNQTVQLKAWRLKMQLIFYELLCISSARFKNFNDIRAQLVFVETDSTTSLKLEHKAKAEELNRLRRLVEAVWKKIVNLDLPDISKYSPDIEGIHQFEEDLISGKI